jgi:cytochrome P450
MSTALNINDINIFATETLIDPWDAYQCLRDEAPIAYMPAMDVHVITRYDLLMEAIRDTETYSSRFDRFMAQARGGWLQNAAPDVVAQYQAIMSKAIVPPPTMLTLDPPDHTSYRSLVNRVFTAGLVRKMQPYIEGVITETIDGFIDGGDVDFMEKFAFPIPLRIIADRLGVPDGVEERKFFYAAATAAASGLRLTTPSDDVVLQRAQLNVDLQSFLIGLAAERRKAPQDDMISILANARLEEQDRPLTGPEIFGILSQFLVAGHETTTSTFGWAMMLLCQQPHLQDAIRGDASAAKTFVEEVLRLEAPVQGLPRVVTKDTELGGYALKEGDMVLLRYGAANRDERQFACPNDVDLARKNAGSQMAFGSGTHHCPGAPLARQELNLGIPMLLDRMKNFRLNPAFETPQAEPSFILRSLPELHIQFDKRG